VPSSGWLVTDIIKKQNLLCEGNSKLIFSQNLFVSYYVFDLFDNLQNFYANALPLAIGNSDFPVFIFHLLICLKHLWLLLCDKSNIYLA